MPYIYPTSAEVREIEPDLLKRGREGRLGFDILPERNVNTAKVRWTQKDNYTGLQQMRGLDGAPLHVIRVGQKSFEYEPGVFGEFVDITETELTTRAASVDVTTAAIDVNDLVLEAQEFLIGREYDRKESSIWTLLATGTLNIIQDGPNGVQFTYSDTYNFQQYSAGFPWSNFGASTPIKNFQGVQQLGFAAGHSVNFGAGAKAYANQVTINNMLNNQNANDFAGRRSEYGATLNSLAGFNSYFATQNLPSIVPYDEGYVLKPGTPFTKHIPDNVIIVVGQRPSGAKVGWYQVTRNASNRFRPGSYSYTIDRANAAIQGAATSEKRTPANIEIHRGHNGGPSIDYPSSIVVMHV